LSNYIQPGSAQTSGVMGVEAQNRAINPAVTVMPHVAGSANGNPLNLSAPIVPYQQPDTTARPLQPGQLAGTTLGRSKNGPFEKS